MGLLADMKMELEMSLTGAAIDASDLMDMADPEANWEMLEREKQDRFNKYRDAGYEFTPGINEIRERQRQMAKVSESGFMSHFVQGMVHGRSSARNMHAAQSGPHRGRDVGPGAPTVKSGADNYGYGYDYGAG